MGEIRPFGEEHAEQAAKLYFTAMRGNANTPGKDLAKYFCEILLSNPWASPEIPSLVYLEEGRIVGMLGVVPRPMVFRGKAILAATTTQFMVRRGYRGPAAIQLLRRVFQGPQDLTWTDGAAEEVNGLWTALGGYTASLYGFNWIRILRPFGTGRSVLSRAGRAGRIAKQIAGVVTSPADFVLSRMAVSALGKPSSPYLSKLVSSDELLACIDEIGWRESLRPAYSQPSFSWLIQQAAMVKSQDLRMVVVTDRQGVRCGWFVYYAERGEAGYVLQIGAKRRDQFADILRALFADAWHQGTVCVKGASIPGCLSVLTGQHCIFRHPTSATLIQSRNAELLNAVRLGEAAMTRLDGECWLRFAREDWL
jgi:hypothetical protein